MVKNSLFIYDETRRVPTVSLREVNSMPNDDTHRCAVRINEYGTDPLTVAQKIADRVNAANAWIILHGHTTTAAQVALYLHLFSAKAFRFSQPRGVCVSDAGRAFVHWDRSSIFPRGTELC